MKNTSIPQPTNAELEILKFLWKLGPSTVKLINQKLNEIKEVGYTTTLKTMQIMTDKNMLTRDTEGRSHIYSPAFKEEDVQGQMLDRLLNTAFGGSAKKLVMQTLGNHQTSKQELDEIRRFLDEIENQGE